MPRGIFLDTVVQLPALLGLHSEQSWGEFFLTTGLEIQARKTPNGSLAALPLVCPRAKSGQQYILRQLWMINGAAKGMEKGMGVWKVKSINQWVCMSVARPDPHPAIKRYKC